MRVKLRPDAHCVPVARGVYWVRGEHSFVLAGPPALYALLDEQLDALLEGTSVDAMVTATGNEAARPVVEHVFRALIAQDVLIDLDAVDGSPPDPETAARHAELLAYLETHCAQPYRAFAAVLAGRVAIGGEGPAAAAARRGLAAQGITEHSGISRDHAIVPGPVTVAILIDDVDKPADLTAAARALPPGTPVLPVVAGSGFALVGPVCATPADLRSFQAVRARIADWQRTGDDVDAPRPVSAVLAGALAAHAALAHLAGTADGTRDALVVYGHDVQTRTVAIPDPGAGPVWQDVDAAATLTAAAARLSDDLAAGLAVAIPLDSEEPPPVHRLSVELTARWTGVARWGLDLDLPQIPVSLVTAQTVAGPGPSETRVERPDGADPADMADEDHPQFLGWGRNRIAAGVTAVLGVLRHRVVQECSGETGDGLPAAGLTPVHWLTDGLLRHLGPRVLGATAGVDLSWEQLQHSSTSGLASLLREFYGVPTTLRLHPVPGLSWRLAQAVHERTGEVLATQWGPTPFSAGYAALLAATGQAQFAAAARTTPQAPVRPPDPIGTWSLDVAPEHQVQECLGQLLAHLDDRGLRPHAHRLVRDAATGALPLTCGWVALR